MKFLVDNALSPDVAIRKHSRFQERQLSLTLLESGNEDRHSA